MLFGSPFDVLGSFKDQYGTFAQVPTGSVPDLYIQNREWAEEQAQRQMDYQTSANRIAMNFEQEQSEATRAFQTYMANSAYQRAVADLKKAGLNPILAYSQGGAAVPSVSSARGVTSSGARASMVDTGYTSAKADADAEKVNAQLRWDAAKLAVNTALTVFKTIANSVSNAIPF